MDVNEAKVRLAGAMISVATPATPGGDIDFDAYRRNLRFMVGRGVAEGNAVLLVAAAGGEFPMLTVAERKRLMDVAIEEVGDIMPVAVSVQSNSTREAIELAVHARAVGVALGQLSAPFYYPPTPLDIHEFFKEVATASRLPLMVYNNWWNTVSMNLDTVLRLVELDHVVAVKWSAPTQDQYVEGLEALAGRVAVIDNALQHVNATLMGATGFITHISNFWPEYPLRLWRLMNARAYEELTEALAFKRRWRRWVEAATQYTEGEGPFIKVAMDEVGLPSGDPFPPSRPLSDELRRELRDLFAEFKVPVVAD